jgi:hypothetical protein
MITLSIPSAGFSISTVSGTALLWASRARPITAFS